MNAQNENSTFEIIIVQALRACGGNGFPPFRIFQAAVGDLAGAYPRERAFLLRIADEQYYSLCVKAADGLWEGNVSGLNAASQYLQNSFMVDDGWSEYITRALGYAFAEYKYGAKPAAPEEPAGQGNYSAPKQAAMPQQNPARAPKQTSAPRPARAPEQAAMPQQGPAAPVNQAGTNAKPKGSKKPIIIGAAAAAVIVLAVVFLLVGRSGGMGTQNSTYSEEGVTFTLPGTYDEHYTYFTADLDDSSMLTIDRSRYSEDSFEAHWKQTVEWSEDDSECNNVQTGEMEIDGETCYWMSYQFDDEYIKELYMPLEEQNCATVGVWDEAGEKTNEKFDSLVKGIHFTEDQGDTDGYINRFGISVPNESRWELSDCSYNSQDNKLTVDYGFDDATDGSGLNASYREDLDFVSDDSDYTVLEQGETEIDGAKGRWFDYTIDFGGGDLSYEYSLFFQHKSQIIHMQYWFDKEGDHSSEVQKINDSIHFEDE